MKYQEILQETYQIGNELQDSINNIILQEQYCVKMQIITKYLQQKKELADLQLKNFREVNDKIFSQAIKILDLAIENANVELAKASLDTISAMKKTYPDFYKSFNETLFL